MKVFCNLLLTMAFSVATVFAQGVHRPPTPSQEAERQEKLRARAERDALRELDNGTITLEQAATRAGGHVTIDARPNPDAFQAPDLSSLAKQSSLVVMGRVVGEPQVQLSDDQRSIVTRYMVLVDEVIRGHKTPALMKVATVEVLGGRVNFNGGAYAEFVNDLELKTGDRYVLYLRDRVSSTEGKSMQLATPASDAAAVFVPAGYQHEGIFRVADGNVVSLAASATNRLKRQYDGKPVEAFLAQVRAAR
jgi:hypothetical protein